MADTDDKTEEATAKRKGESRSQGMVPRSLDLNSSLVLLAGTFGLWLFLGRTVKALEALMRECLQAISTFEQVPGALHLHARILLSQLLWILFPFLLLVAAVGIGISFLQVGFLFTLKPLGPHFGKVFSLAGLARILSPHSLVELLKSCVKMGIIAVIGYQVVAKRYREYLVLADAGLGEILSLAGSVMFELLFKCAAALLLLGFADLWYQRFEHRKRIRMSKQEVKDEMRNAEGDPHIKGKIKSLRLQMHRNMMMHEVPKATVVVTNPTFLAIAVRYRQGIDEAPTVVAKGQRLQAERIRDLAREHGIPLVEDKPLARGLYEAVEAGDQVPAEFFAAMAEILAYVYGLKGAKP